MRIISVGQKMLSLRLSIWRNAIVNLGLQSLFGSKKSSGTILLGALLEVLPRDPSFAPSCLCFVSFAFMRLALPPVNGFQISIGSRSQIATCPFLLLSLFFFFSSRHLFSVVSVGSCLHEWVVCFLLFFPF